jgi:two-component system, OmpR family, heavy metal sensor histidine kinase CusS
MTGEAHAGPAYSISRRLSLSLAAVTAVLLGLLCAGIYLATETLHERAQRRLLVLKVNKLTETSQLLLRPGDTVFHDRLQANAQRRPGSRLMLWWPDGRVYYADADEEPHRLSDAQRAIEFTLPFAEGGAPLRGRFAIDVQHDEQILSSLALVLAAATLVGALAAGVLARLAVHHGLRPLRLITHQTEQLPATRWRGRLTLPRQVAELQPWIQRFNALMETVETTCSQLEGFNADVAHELRTPLTSLIGKTELALSRERSVEELSHTLERNLEELTRMSGVVNDMLFLARADHGAHARRGPQRPLAPLVQQVLEFHDAAAAERALRLEVQGDLELAVDEPLVQRAISNLLGNATRHATPGSTVQVRLQSSEGRPCLWVENQGPPIGAPHLPRLFDRFYRAAGTRRDSGAHHGLGLAIVAAIARMHGGTVFAHSDGQSTRIGLSLGPQACNAPTGLATAGR